MSDLRVGIGYDLHRLVERRSLVLGGVRIEYPKGLVGHSDADVVLHAVTDALLGAAGLPDIGEMFPDTDPGWRDADSTDLLRQAWDRVREKGYRVQNLDVIVHAEKPKLTPYKPAMAARIADLLGIDPALVSIKAKTNEGVGEIGRGEAIAATCCALIART